MEIELRIKELEKEIEEGEETLWYWDMSCDIRDNEYYEFRATITEKQKELERLRA